MLLLDTMTQDEMREFENECFRAWLNKLDAIIDYENRRQIPVAEWRVWFDLGDSEYEAAEWLAKHLNKA